MSTELDSARRIVIAGGSGFLGLNLARALVSEGFSVDILARSRPRSMEPGWRFVQWDGRTPGEWCATLDGAAGLVNLAGRTVDCIKTPDHCDEILRSRVESTRVLGQALRRVDRPPPVWVQMSTAHRYGDSVEVVCSEDSAFGLGLAPQVGEAWEEAHAEAMLPDMRSVVVRTSFVLGRSGGALSRLALLARLSLGGKVGHGKQGISWIHERDMDRLFLRALTDPEMEGAYLATAPNPVSNADFMRTLRRALRMPIGLPAFAWMVQLAAPLLLRTDPDLALYGRYCVSERLESEGFEFSFPDLASALADLYARR
ncbi:MAG: DUF1731 domain-containing protein [Acidobacteriota bacterium]